MVGLLKAEDLSPVSKLIENGFPLAGMEINKDDLPEAATQLLDTCGGLTVSLSTLTMHMHIKSYKTIILSQKKIQGNAQMLEFQDISSCLPRTGRNATVCRLNQLGLSEESHTLLGNKILVNEGATIPN